MSFTTNPASALWAFVLVRPGKLLVSLLFIKSTFFIEGVIRYQLQTNVKLSQTGMEVTSRPLEPEQRGEQHETASDIDGRRKRARLLMIEPVQRDDNDESGDSDKESSSPPRAFLCPITRDVMYEPVLDGEGNTYERSALLIWLSEHNTSPVSRQPLTARMVIPNNALRETIHEYMGEAWVRKCSIHEQPKKKQFMNDSKLRAKIDGFLRHTSRDLGGLQLQLNEEGCCAFRYDTITIVLDVPAEVGIFCLYTKGLIPLVSPSERHKLYQRALELNFLQGETRGGCISIRKNSTGRNSKDEIMFSYTDRVSEISGRDFSNILLNFVETAVVLRDKLIYGFDDPLRMMNPEEMWAEEVDDDDDEEEEGEMEDDIDSLDGLVVIKTNSNDATNQNTPIVN